MPEVDKKFLEAMLFLNKFKSFDDMCTAGHDGKVNLLRSTVLKGEVAKTIFRIFAT